MQDNPKNTSPLIAHVIFRLATGGLENGLVNILNNLPPDKYRHAIICMTYDTDFRDRIKAPNVEIHSLHKKAGKDLAVYLRLWRLLRRLKPDILHTRNLSALEAQLPGLLAGVKYRIHSEHGWDINDVSGQNKKYTFIRRCFRPVVGKYVCMSKDLETWLHRHIGIPGDRITQIYNGVDMVKFHPAAVKPLDLLPDGFAVENSIIIGTVGRQEEIKNPLLLLRAFIQLRNKHPEISANLRLIMAGSGVLHEKLQTEAANAGVADKSWFPGDRKDVAELMRTFDIFVLPSLNEGISNTILEAMATGLPIVATRVGGNPELVADRQSGFLVDSDNPAAMAEAIKIYADDPRLMRTHGEAAARICRERFSLERMIGDYAKVYAGILEK